MWGSSIEGNTISQREFLFFFFFIFLFLSAQREFFKANAYRYEYMHWVGCAYPGLGVPVVQQRKQLMVRCKASLKCFNFFNTSRVVPQVNFSLCRPK